MKKASWIIVAILAVSIGLYPSIYFIMDREFGLLGSKSPELLSGLVWNITFYGHIILGGLALLIGWIQFNQKWRSKNIILHRRIGKTYMITVLISGICGFYIALFATGGIISILGFACLAVVWLTTTGMGFNAIKKGKIDLHEKFMIYSYAACFAAVTLRIWLPTLTAILGEFIPAYRIVSWLCWVPNIIVAYFLVSRRATNREATVIE